MFDHNHFQVYSSCPVGFGRGVLREGFTTQAQTNGFSDATEGVKDMSISKPPAFGGKPGGFGSQNGGGGFGSSGGGGGFGGNKSGGDGGFGSKGGFGGGGGGGDGGFGGGRFIFYTVVSHPHKYYNHFNYICCMKKIVLTIIIILAKNSDFVCTLLEMFYLEN